MQYLLTSWRLTDNFQRYHNKLKNKQTIENNSSKLYLKKSSNSSILPCLYGAQSLTGQTFFFSTTAINWESKINSTALINNLFTLIKTD